MTNREVLARKLSKATNEQMALFLKYHLLCCQFCELGKCISNYDGHCKEHIQQWLEQEAKDD